MKFSNTKKNIGIAAMVIVISGLPNTVLASHIIDTRSEMISTSFVLEQLNRAESEKQIQEFISKPEMYNALIKQRLTPSEITERLAILSDIEIRQLSAQIKQQRAGGDVLMAILIVVLIIFLVNRI
jgi:hypothetical protein